MTKLIRSIYNIKTKHQGGVITIGNFDGVHLGHQQLLATVVQKARALSVPCIAITFEPHAFEYFHQEDLKIPRLTRLREKFFAIAETGIDYVLILPFNQNLAKISAHDFVTHILFQALHPVHIITGDDFHFGYQRQGNFELLEKMGKTLGFSVDSTSTLNVQGERVSSTRVRKALAEGDHLLVKQLLGRPYTMMGRIRLGKQLGRQWGFPTANIFLHRKLTPVKGVYTVLMHGIEDHPWPGVANVGIRPTVNGTRTLLEVHLLDFHHEIYGRYVKVEFCEKLRDEVRYPNVELLKEQIAKDVLAARRFFRMRNE